MYKKSGCLYQMAALLGSCCPNLALSHEFCVSRTGRATDLRVISKSAGAAGPKGPYQSLSTPLESSLEVASVKFEEERNSWRAGFYFSVIHQQKSNKSLHKLVFVSHHVYFFLLLLKISHTTKDSKLLIHIKHYRAITCHIAQYA